MEDLNGIYVQPSNGLKINRLQSEKVIFYRQRSKMEVKINRQQALIDKAMTLEPHGLNRRDELL